MESYLHRKLGGSEAVARQVLLEPVRHGPALTRLAALARARGEIALALELADRRCRLSLKPGALELMLRADLLERIGDRSGALADASAALSLDPDSLAANRAMLSWGDSDQRQAAARLLIEREQSARVVVAALAELSRHGVTAVARVTVVDGRLRGWVAWSASKSPAIRIEGRTAPAGRLQHDPHHPLAAGLGRAALVELPTDRSHGIWIGHASGGGELLLARGFSSLDAATASQRPSPHTRRRARKRSGSRITIVVPVYRDLPATRACLDSLLTSIADEPSGIRVVAVDDASPEPGMRDYLRSLPIDLVEHATNLGFVGAVNAALADIDDGDVVLLNADTIVPRGAIGRLAAAARSHPDIGTVTPLSNNGELTSLPVPFRENPLPSAAEIERIAAAAAHVLGTIDLPSGIGFCLYVTRACLDAVGQLSHRYERGYGEDVDFCLSARAAGLRNVCAPQVFVGHAGTRSFGADKRRLVVRNLERLAVRFPGHAYEAAAFMLADPLKPARHAIGRALIDGFDGPLLVACRRSRPLAMAWITGHAADAGDCLVAVHDRGETTFQLLDPLGGLRAETVAATDHDMPLLRPGRMLVWAPAALEASGLDRASAAVELHLADATGLVARPDADIVDTSVAWDRAAARATRIVAATAEAHALALAHWPAHAGKLGAAAVTSPRPTVPGEPIGPPRLGVLLVDETARCRRLLRVFAGTLPRLPDGAPAVVVLGGTVDDIALMKAGGLVVSGACDTTDLAAMAVRYRVSHLMLLASGALLGSHEEAAAWAMPLPLCRMSWTGEPRADGGDLWLDPTAPDATIADGVRHWMQSGNETT